MKKDNLLIIIIIVAMLGAAAIIPFATEDTTTFTVRDKERVITGTGENMSSKYLVFTESETFKNSDCMVRGKWNSSDVYSQLQPGTTYTATVYGWRIPFMSSYRNILTVSEKQ